MLSARTNRRTTATWASLIGLLALAIGGCNATAPATYAHATWSVAEVVPTFLPEEADPSGPLVPVALVVSKEGALRLFYIGNDHNGQRRLIRQVERAATENREWSAPYDDLFGYHCDVLVDGEWTRIVIGRGKEVTLLSQADATDIRTTLLNADETLQGSVPGIKSFHYPKQFLVGDQLGLLTLAQRKGNPVRYDLILRTSTKSKIKGMNWNKPETVATELRLATPTPVVMLDNQILIYYPNPSSGRITQARRTVGEQAWNRSTVPTGTDGESVVAIPVAVAVEHGRVYLAYERITRRGTSIYHLAISDDHGTTWHKAGRITPGESRVDDLSHNVSLKVNRGVLAFARTDTGGDWTDGKNNAEVFTSEDHGATWQHHKIGETKEYQSIQPIIEFDETNGQLQIAYGRTDPADGSQQIVLQQLRPGPPTGSTKHHAPR